MHKQRIQTYAHLNYRYAIMIREYLKMKIAENSNYKDIGYRMMHMQKQTCANTEKANDGCNEHLLMFHQRNKLNLTSIVTKNHTQKESEMEHLQKKLSIP